MNEVIINENKVKAKKFITLWIVFLIISIYTLFVGLLEVKLFYIIAGAIIIVIFGTTLIFIVKGVLTLIPLLLIGTPWITDKSTVSSVGFIGWQEIQSINVIKSFGQQYIGITVYDLVNLWKEFLLQNN